MTGWGRRVLGMVVGAVLLLPAGVAAAATGALDSSFSGDGRVRTNFGGGDRALAVAVQPDGKLLVAGLSYRRATERQSMVVVRYLVNGEPDPGFGTDGVTVLPGAQWGFSSAPVALRVRPDGRILVVASDFEVVIARLLANGAPDPSYGDGGIATGWGTGNGTHDLLIQPDGKVLVAGETQYSAGWVVGQLVRLLPNGERDPAFAPVDGPDDWGYGQFDALALQPDGRIVFSDTGVGLRRLMPNGAVDSSFGAGGLAASGVWHSAVAVQPDGRIIGLGRRLDSGATVVERWLPNGTPDRTFGVQGVRTVPLDGPYRDPTGIAVQPNGRILIAGASGATMAVVRLQPTGALDTSFGSGGVRRIAFSGATAAAAFDLALQANGRIVVAGEAIVDADSQDHDLAVARLTGDAVAACNGKAPTIASGEAVLHGSDGPDVIVGSLGPDVVYAGGGNDTVCTAAGNDRVHGEPGADRLQGGLGNDRLEGGFGADLLLGEGGDDLLLGLADDDRLDGGTGTDHADGGAGTDTGVANETQVDVP